ncbi:Metallo-dependent phosphatase-like protein [Sordaria brevicollis]|uniref:Metallo-dependent phosphatase-like protein n=1 Tax=Sordaria brevicollis TaxID=83679 RepID=A0AAE0U994_SORBR|nr:Metallo-dependent phosphatase-like protein [Sordaria brevicollis]
MAVKASILVASAIATLARAAQPGAASPIAAPMRDLVWGKLNFLHTTDTHGWHGDIYKKHKADGQGVDLLLVDTGDRVEGNGLYDASNPKGKYYYDIYREQNVDIICTGNHELYHASTADGEHLRTVPNFQEQYVASNLDYIDPKTGLQIPMAQRYRKFQTKNQKLTIVAMGFLFDFTVNANNTVVQPVRETIKEAWFQDAIRENPDVFVIIGHVGVKMPEFKEIFTAIRKQNWFTPILFFGGHVHVRDATAYDLKSFAIASGRYFETIGWMSVDGDLKKTGNKKDDAPSTEIAGLSFHRRYIDNNLLGLYYHTGLNESTFHTDHGRNVSQMIAQARKDLDLDYTFGCAPKDLWMTRAPYPSEDSIYTWLEKEVLPAVAVNEDRKDKPRLVIMNTGAIRFDIFKGKFTRDTTYIISPFLSVLHYIPDVPYTVASKVIDLLNNAGKIMEEAQAMEGDNALMDARFMGIPEQFAITEDIIHERPLPSFVGQDVEGQKPLLSGDGPSKKEPVLIEGYTTRDDIGDDGDDAVHSAINFYVVPNCIQAEVGFPRSEKEDEKKPEKVDLVFFDFIQPWVMVALKISGGDYTNDDVKSYVDGTFTELMAGWIKKNWPADC